ncbi:hypothetical protein D3C87_1612810 [compost metagenome]
MAPILTERGMAEPETKKPPWRAVKHCRSESEPEAETDGHRMVVAVAGDLPRITDAEFAGRADLEVHPGFKHRAVLGNRHTLHGVRGTAVDKGHVRVGLGVTSFRGQTTSIHEGQGAMTVKPAMGYLSNSASTLVICVGNMLVSWNFLKMDPLAEVG